MVPPSWPMTAPPGKSNSSQPRPQALPIRPRSGSSTWRSCIALTLASLRTVPPSGPVPPSRCIFAKATRSRGLIASLKALGADVTLKGVDSPGLNTAYFGTGAWDVSMAPVTLNLPSQLVSFVSGPVPPDGTNFGHIQNKDYESSVQTAATKAGSDGCDDWNNAEKALVKAVDAVPYENALAPIFGKNATFTVSDALDPTSIRMHG